MHWVCIRVCLMFLSFSSWPQAAGAEGSPTRRYLETVEGQLTLSEAPPEVLLLKGAWRFSKNPLPELSPEDFVRLPLKDPLTGNLQFLYLAEDPPEGAYVLSIKADKNFVMDLRLGGVVAAAEFKLFTPSGVQILFQSPDYAKVPKTQGRNQIVNPILTLNIEAGTSFLVYNYYQKPFTKMQTEATNAGLVGPIRIGSRSSVARDLVISEIFLKFPLGVFACLAIYSLLIFYSRRGEDQDSLILFAFNAATFLKEFFSQGIYSSFLQPNHFMITASAVGYSMPLLATAVSIYFLNLKYPTRVLKILFTIAWINALVSAVNGIILLNASFLPNSTVMTGLNTLVNAVVFFLVFIPYAIYCALKTKNLEIVFFSIGIFCLGAGTLTDFINISLSLGWPWLSMWGGMMLSIILAKNNSRMFARAFDSSKKLNVELELKNQEVKNLNASLEIRVVERTAEIKALLEHIPQGILSIADQGIVESNYSAHLPDILEHSSIAGQSFKTLCLDLFALSSDERDQAWQAILASIGEPSLNFEVNCDKLPLEVDYCYQGKKKAVKLTWNTELDRDENVKRILVTLLDITQEIEAKRELEEKNKDLSIIKQLIDVGNKKASQFFGTAEQLLAENGRIIELSELNIDTLKILFVNIHTVKGAARTLQFKDLSNVLHEVESQYAAIIKKGQTIPRNELLKDIRRAQETFNRYLQVNREVLGRSDDFTKIQIDRDFLEQHYQLLHLLDQKTGLTGSLRDVIHRNRDELTLLIFMSLDSVMQETLAQSEKIARDLQKEPPILAVNVGDILINHRQEITIKNSFIHILRNALDHGIETADERRAAGKAPQGTIHLQAIEDAACIQIEVWDDGRGLAIDSLREKGESSGYLAFGASDQEVADTIFNQGTSTAATVSQISGRGVGMDAVKRFFEAEKGHIQILLGPPIAGKKGYFSFKFRITLPRGDSQMTSKVDGSESSVA